MKRILIALFLFFVFSDVSYAQIGGMIQNTGPSGTLCPPFYADSNVVLSWWAENGGDTGYACDSAGNQVTVTENGTVDIGSYGSPALASMRITDGDLNTNYLSISQTAGQYMSMGSNDQVICLKYYTTDADITQSVYLFTGFDSEGDDGLHIYLNAGEYLSCQWRSEGGNTSMNESSLVKDSWATMACTWNYVDGSSDFLGANPGDLSPWTNGWDQINQAIGTQGEDIENIYIGPRYGSDGDSGDDYIVRQWVIIDNTYGYNSYNCETALTDW